jgi:superfamily II DNA or RNA helicase
LALIQTIRDTDLVDLAGRFGAVFIDEAHHLAATSFYETVNSFTALYRLWASATPTRQDGLTKMVYAAGGPVLYEIGLHDLPVIIPSLQVIETSYSGHNENYTKLISDLIQNKRRNHLIVDTIVRETPGNYSLVLSDRIEHLHTLAAMLKEAAPGMRIETLTGKLTSKKQREAIMEQAQNREIDVLLSTQLAREGLDLPHLNRLFLVTPKRAAGATQQEIGRVMRPCEGKQDAVVFDFVDFNSPILRAQFWRRRDVYRQLGMDTKRKACRRQAMAGVS